MFCTVLPKESYILYIKLQYKIGQDFLDRQYVTKFSIAIK